MPRLVNDIALAGLAVVANNAMNRERGLSTYRAELGLDPLAGLGAGGWLDLCCGSGRALLEAAGRGHRLVGVDLVDYFHSRHPDVDFHTASLTDWNPDSPFDLITCVHGLHYLGDKLALLARASTWLTPSGRFAANFDAASIQGPSRRALLTALRDAGFTYNPRRKHLTRTGPAQITFPFTYLGADPAAGPNYTGQPAVTAHYA
ncbi:class I SAM-dependent methyltransferase [Actinokineospora sp. NPDC004072]